MVSDFGLMRGHEFKLPLPNLYISFLPLLQSLISLPLNLQFYGISPICNFMVSLPEYVCFSSPTFAIFDIFLSNL